MSLSQIFLGYPLFLVIPFSIHILFVYILKQTNWKLILKIQVVLSVIGIILSIMFFLQGNMKFLGASITDVNLRIVLGLIIGVLGYYSYLLFNDLKSEPKKYIGRCYLSYRSRGNPKLILGEYLPIDNALSTFINSVSISYEIYKHLLNNRKNDFKPIECEDIMEVIYLDNLRIALAVKPHRVS